jgi:hypothetical protein
MLDCHAGPMADDPAAAVGPLPRLRAICRSMPQVTERLSHGEPTWFVSRRTFVSYADRHHDDRVAFWCAAAPGQQQELVAEDPERYFVPPYVGGRGWLGVRVDVVVDWQVVAELIEDAYRVVASPRLTAELDARDGGDSRGGTALA